MGKIYNIPINKKCVIAMLVISIISVIQTFYGINEVLEMMNIQNKLNFFDIISIVLFGITNMKGASIIDIFRWIAPYIIIIYFVGIYIENIILTGNSYMWINRFKKRELWIQSILKEVLKIIVIYLGIYFVGVCITSIIVTGNMLSFSTGFLEIYSEIQAESVSYFHIVIQFVISFFILSVIIIVHAFINIRMGASGKGEIAACLTIVGLGCIGKMDIYNPIMLFKHSILDKNMVYSLTTTIILSTALFILGVVLFVKIVGKKGSE
ncbi:MAG: hypothetical protein ACRC30_14715 [Clostridium sp.]